MALEPLADRISSPLAIFLSVVIVITALFRVGSYFLAPKPMPCLLAMYCTSLVSSTSLLAVVLARSSPNPPQPWTSVLYLDLLFFNFGLLPVCEAENLWHFFDLHNIRFQHACRVIAVLMFCLLVALCTWFLFQNTQLFIISKILLVAASTVYAGLFTGYTRLAYHILDSKAHNIAQKTRQRSLLILLGSAICALVCMLACIILVPVWLASQGGKIVLVFWVVLTMSTIFATRLSARLVYKRYRGTIADAGNGSNSEFEAPSSARGSSATLV